MAEPGVKLRRAELSPLPAVDGPAFQGDPYEGFRVVTYRFEGSDKAQVVTENAPLAINPVFQ
jgi:hypothetical protein